MVLSASVFISLSDIAHHAVIEFKCILFWVEVKKMLFSPKELIVLLDHKSWS